MKSVFISILNFNGSSNTLDCVRSLRKINIRDFELTVIVVDNNSSEKLSLRNESSQKIKLIIIKNEKNFGFSGGHNIAIRYAINNGADYVLILNNDTYVHENFLKELLEVAESDNEVGILSPKIYFAPGFEFHKDRYRKEEMGKVFWYAGGEMDWDNVIGHHRGVDKVDEGQFNVMGQTELATGCCMLIKREVIEKVGVFDGKYFLYYEDTDLSIRVKRKGFKIAYVPGSVIWHKNAESAGGSGSALQDYFITRNRLVFGFRFAPIHSKLAIFRESINLVFRGRKWQKQGILDFYLRRLGKGSYKI